ncbi:MAG: glycosyltransferase family 4 protein [Chthoniobacterales bacterium]|nr:glycosyltransferase family 4 protein [Chthoniobacterales bacterium]
MVACPLALLPEYSGTVAADRALLEQIRKSSVLIVGRMSARERYKGHDQLLESWPRVLRVVPGAQLVVAGKGDDLERLRAKAGALGIGGDVLFPGFVSEETLAALRERVSVFAMPSSGEGFGLVYLDAMRAALPCIGGSRDAGAEVIVDGETGICVDPSDTEALSSAVSLLLTTPELREAYGAAGRRRFDAVFTFERYCERLLPILRNAFT